MTIVRSTTTGDDTYKSHPPAGAMFWGSIGPVCNDQRNSPVASLTAKMRPVRVAAITSPCATAGEEWTGPFAANVQTGLPLARSRA